MGETGLYETDVYEWSERQAAALRSLAARRDLPNDLDLDNVAEEIESVGKSQLDAVNSFVRLILSHCILCLVDPEAQSVDHWAVEIDAWRVELNDRITASMTRHIDVEKQWRNALRQARLKLVQQRRADALLALDHAAEDGCPVHIGELTAEYFELAALVVAMRARLAEPGTEDGDVQPV